MKYGEGIEKEQLTIELFRIAGWNIKINEKKDSGCSYTPDFDLLLNNKVVGFVEIIVNLSTDRLAKKLELMRNFVINNKKMILIITDLISFYICRNNKIETLYRVPTPLDLKLRNSFESEEC